MRRGTVSSRYLHVARCTQEGKGEDLNLSKIDLWFFGDDLVLREVVSHCLSRWMEQVLEDFLIDDCGVDDLLLLLGFGSLGHCVTNFIMDVWII